jgi:hypothetical protein
MTFLGQLLQDLRYATRVVARQPGTTFIIVLSLALGIGANTLVFSLVNAILIRSLPYPEPDRLVRLFPTPPNRPNQTSQFNAPVCIDLPTKDSVFTAAGCYIGVAGNVADPEDALTTGPEWLEGEMLTYHAVQALGVKPALGRWFTQAEDHGDAEKVMLISYDLWQRRFNGVPDILGKRLRVADFGGNDTPSTIIGVMPPGFTFANFTSDYFVPLRATGRGRNSPARNRDVMRALGRALRRPAVLPVPAFALRLLLGEMADEMLLGSQRAVPRVARERGFTWSYPDLQTAMNAAVASGPR